MIQDKKWSSRWLKPENREILTATKARATEPPRASTMRRSAVLFESGKVDERAHEAEHALETPERSVMKRAEEIGKSHKRAEDPEITRKP